MDNIIEKHINNVQKRLKKYNTLILKSRYDKWISDELIQTYIDARYYNYGTNDKIRFFYKRIYDALLKKGELLVKKEPRKKELIDKTIPFFQYYFYFDFVRNTDDIDHIVESLAEKRLFKLNLKSAVEDDNFKSDFAELVKNDIKDVKELLISYGSKDFDLSLNRYSSNTNYCNVSLNYYFDFPPIFSEQVIREIFNTDVVAEDKLFVEYPMISAQALKDILSGDFDKKYLCDFAPTLFSKKSKVNQVLQLIDNQAAQDKIYLKIKYNDFLEYKKGVFETIKKGFKFALYTEENMPKLANDELKVLEVFPCVITSKQDVNVNKYKNVIILQD